VKLVRLFRLIRVLRFIKVLDEERFISFFRIIIASLDIENKMYFLYLAKYFFKIFKLLLLGIGITYFLGCSWYLSVKYLCDET